MTKESSLNLNRIVDHYLTAKELIIRSGFGPEIDWQDELHVEDLTESGFLRELAWVILSSGMRESVIRGRFPRIEDAFLEWSSASAIVKSRRTCIRRAFAVFRHAQKIRAIADAARSILRKGFDVIKAQLTSDGISALEGFSFIGSVTVFHLAKNLGMDVVKPDRHLCRLSVAAGYSEPGSLCRDISLAVGDRLSVVDLVLWRFATLRKDYCSYFATGIQGIDDRNERRFSRKVPSYRGKRELSLLC
jgi:hypothetical protein